jgi:hypothetical protein
VVNRQIECGVDIPNDGEYVKAVSYTGYMQERVSGWFSQRPVRRGQRQLLACVRVR